MEQSPSPAPKGPAQAYPRTFGRYRLLSPIAMGGMAEVFLAEMLGPLGFRRRVAIKRILPHLAQNKEFVRSFVDEARLNGLLVHPNIVQILDFSFVDKVPYLAMEYVEGGHLGHVLDRMHRKGARMPAPIIVALFSQIGRGLEWAHQARDVDGTPINLIHRDVKPSNLLLGFDGHVKIADFGIAKASSNLTQTQPSMVKGSMPYMSPEQAMGVAPLTQASDLFSMGAVAFECLTGERLYPPTTNAMVLLGMVARGPSPERLALLDELPEEYAPLAPPVKRLLAVEPGDRYPDAGAFVAALEHAGVPPASQEELAAFAQRWLSAEDATTSRQIVVPPGPRAGGAPPSAPPAAGHPEKTPPRAPEPFFLPGDTGAATLPGNPSLPEQRPTPGPVAVSEPRKPTTEPVPLPTRKPGGAPAPASPPPSSGPAKDRSSVRPSGDLANVPAVTPRPEALEPAGADAVAPPETASRRRRLGKPVLAALLLALLGRTGGLVWQLAGDSTPPIVVPVGDPSARAWLHVVSDMEGRLFVNDTDAGSPPCEVGVTSLEQPIRLRLVLPNGESKSWEGPLDEGKHLVVAFDAQDSPETWVLSHVPSPAQPLRLDEP